MPYSAEHKQQTREKVLHSAYLLFCSKGFEGISVNEIMADCQLTRGAFYAHFESKVELYAEAIQYGFSLSNIRKEKPTEVTDKQWLGALFDGYLSLQHVEGDNPCPLAFLSTDIAVKDKEIQQIFAKAYQGLNKKTYAIASKFSNCSTQDIQAITAMMIGAVAIARNIENKKSAREILRSCRQQIQEKLEGV